MRRRRKKFVSMMTASPGFEFFSFLKNSYSFGCAGSLAVACGI